MYLFSLHLSSSRTSYFSSRRYCKLFEAIFWFSISCSLFSFSCKMWLLSTSILSREVRSTPARFRFSYSLSISKSHRSQTRSFYALSRESCRLVSLQTSQIALAHLLQWRFGFLLSRRRLFVNGASHSLHVSLGFRLSCTALRSSISGKLSVFAVMLYELDTLSRRLSLVAAAPLSEDRPSRPILSRIPPSLPLSFLLKPDRKPPPLDDYYGYSEVVR